MAVVALELSQHQEPVASTVWVLQRRPRPQLKPKPQPATHATWSQRSLGYNAPAGHKAAPPHHMDATHSLTRARRLRGLSRFFFFFLKGEGEILAADIASLQANRTGVRASRRGVAAGREREQAQEDGVPSMRSEEVGDDGD